MKTSIRSYISAIVFSVLSFCSMAQELNMNVTIDASQIPDINKDIIAEMKNQITSFLNTRQWVSKDEFQPFERIRGNFSILITGQPAPYSYTATLQMQVTRPVYGTGYETILTSFIDKNFNFTLAVGEQMNFNENTFNSNLTSMLGFYAYIILALDYDSFGKLSGTPHIEKAYNIANIAVQEGGGWATNGDPNNRFSLIADLNNQLLLPFRENFYAYHRLGMDTYLKDPDDSRVKILEMLQSIKRIYKVKPYSILIRSFFQAKRDELINIFRDGSDEMKQQSVELLRELDPLNSERYNTILQRR